MILSFIGNHTFAVVRGSENYDTIKSSFRDVLRDINRLIERGFILVEGHLVPVEIFLGGDYKVSFVKHDLLTFQNRLGFFNHVSLKII